MREEFHVVARLADLADPGAREFFVGEGDWPFRGFLVHLDGTVRAYVNVCPHKRYPLNLADDEFLVPGQRLLRCASHNALWEKNHLLLFQASLEWLRDGAVNGSKSGIVKLGY